MENEEIEDLDELMTQRHCEWCGEKIVMPDNIEDPVFCDEECYECSVDIHSIGYV